MSSSETTQILFNSPALRSLKRDQLIKLCKVHSIKASGKNVQLVQRLKDHAATLPLGSPLSVATRSEPPQDDSDSISSRLDSQRPSEQWEVVMEDIPELPEANSRGTLSSLRSIATNAPDEFGTGGGSKSSSVTSSLRAMANSFNFKRPATSNKSDNDRTAQTDINDELATYSVPYSSIPEPSQADMPTTDHFKFSTPDTTIDDHIPGRPGHIAPTGGTAGPPRTTIRLVSTSNSISTLSPEPGTPQLMPVDPVFDLVMGSPDAQGQSRVPVWPLSPQPGPSERLYPVLPVDELEEAKQRQTRSRLPGTGNTTPSQARVSSAKVYPKPLSDVQDLFSPAPKQPSIQKESIGIPRSEPFLFGSPLPRHSVSNKAFDTAAASVLEEMNKRLSAAGVQKVGTDVFGTIPVTTTNRNSGSLGALGKADRFDKVHEEQFNKMDSITNHYAARRGSKKRKSDVLGHGSEPAKNRSSADTQVIRIAPPKRMGIPGGFDDEEEVVDDVREEEDRRMSKRVRVLEEDGGRDKGRRLTISPRKAEAEEKHAKRERAVTRKMLDMRKEKRRSSRHGRVSLAGPQAASNKGKATPRFGFLSSAKSIVRSVWNFGAGSPAKASRTSAALAVNKSKTTGVAEPKETKSAPPPKKPSLAASRPSESLASRKSIAPARVGSTSGKALKLSEDGATKGGSTRSRPPSLSSKTMLNPASAGSTSFRQRVRAGSANTTTSNGTSMPAGRVPFDESADTSTGANNKASIFSLSRTTSRLFTPTASSLAKMRSPAASGPPAATASVKKSKTSAIIAQRAKTPPGNAAVLDAITNSPRGGGSSGNPGSSPPQGNIFTTPLLVGSPNQAVIPPPIKPTSLGAAATTLAPTAPTTTTMTTTAHSGSPERPPLASGYPSSSTFAPASAARRTPASPSTTTTITRMKTAQPSNRKPRISRSRIIAKLGAQRAAATTATTATIGTSSSTVLSRPAVGATAGSGSRIPRASGSAVRSPRVRSSMGTATRRSYAGTKSASRGSDMLMSAKKHARQSEYVRRRSRMVGSAVGAGAGVGATNDETMDMDIDED